MNVIVYESAHMNGPDEICQDICQYVGDLLNWKHHLPKLSQLKNKNQCFTSLRADLKALFLKLVQRHCNKSS